MPARKTPRWSARELEILREVYPRGGVERARQQLPGRSWHAVHVKAHKLGLRCEKVSPAPEAKLHGEALEEAIRLREQQGWSFARIGATFGVSEAGTCNAVLTALCARKGFTPAQRDEFGRLTSEGRDRLRYALRKGLKGVEIQLRLGLSAGRISEERRRYSRELKAAGKVPLPPPGAGAAYSGVKLSAAKKREVEALLLQGLGACKITARTGVSNTSVGRIRNRLVKRLRRRGETLPGCDVRGVRHVQAESSRFVPDEAKQLLRRLLLDRIPVRRAAAMVAVGTCTAYRARDELAAELAARGETLPKPILPGRVRPGQLDQSFWPPAGAREIYAFRELLRQMSFDDAKTAWRMRKADEHAAEVERRRAERERPKSFEEQLDRIRRGEIGIVLSTPRYHLDTTLLRPEELPPLPNAGRNAGL